MSKKIYEEEGRNLDRLFKSKGIENRAEFARENKTRGGGNMISQHIKGHRPISMEAGIAYAKGFNVYLSEISERLAQIIESAPMKNDDGKEKANAWPFKTRYEDFVSVPQPVKNAIEQFISIASKAYPISNDDCLNLIDAMNDAKKIMREEVKKKRVIKS